MRSCHSAGFSASATAIIRFRGPCCNTTRARGGYVVNLDKSQLEGAPSYDVGVEPAWNDPEYESEIHDYYGVGPYWGAPQARHPASPLP